MNIIFVKVGTLYSYKHVNKLYESLIQYYPDATYYCYTEDCDHINDNVSIIPPILKLKKWWNKLALFSDKMPFEGECLYFDLDIDIKSNPQTFINKSNSLTIINSYWKDEMYYDKHAYDVNINSSIITWNSSEQHYIWKSFNKNRDYFMRKYKGIDRFIVHEKIDHNTFKDGVVHSVNFEKVYPNAPIDIYNGLPYEL
jgi:hypothetical protein